MGLALVHCMQLLTTLNGQLVADLHINAEAHSRCSGARQLV